MIAILAKSGDQVLQRSKQMLKLNCNLDGGDRCSIDADVVFTTKKQGEELRKIAHVFNTESVEHQEASLACRAYSSEANDKRFIDIFNDYDRKGFHLRKLVLLTKYWMQTILEQCTEQEWTDLFWLKSFI